MKNSKKVTAAVIKVGDGRGFIIAHKRRVDASGDHYVLHERYVITAAHCLPRLPIVHGKEGWSERDTTYQNLLAPLGCEPDVWAECVFADPVSDIAVLRHPDTRTIKILVSKPKLTTRC